MKQVLWICLLLLFSEAGAQDTAATDGLQQKAQQWVDGLKLDDKAKAAKVQQAIMLHLTAVRDWHNAHPFSEVPAGINPATGNKLSDLDRQLIACSSKPATVHTALMQVLNAELNAKQVAFILDQYTIGKVAFTLKGYEAIVPDLTEKERSEIRKNLEQAREQAIDYKSMREISAIFEICKTKCEQYLNNNGRNWRQLFKNYVDKVKAEKEKKKG
ncbi:hypothetical protein A8C56_04400 [Niabella ginsenosidivorans]|uniref:DUF3826 domain-containing protein n=1 Tax=Niabella ginsenosidivorans TaxID=1176587 RepID=A0A1A9HZS2_9BACT|nr:DUF3826 domain-containing protein [Niabella ginsenosidivorans]ANH80319.1 hypothetical protein A8C56_04400 [Niabella ginsenosidivorans]